MTTTTPAPAAPTLAEVVAFLDGSGPLMGCHFGDRPLGERGPYWWRKYLRAALASPTSAAPQVEPMEMCLCESRSVVLRLGQPYVFKEMEGCASCKEMADQAREAYGPDGGAPIAAALAAQSPDGGAAPAISDDELKDLGHEAHEEALSFGLDSGLFLRYFKTIRDRAARAQPAATALTQAARDVLAERARQIEREGYEPDSDDGYEGCELAAAAATYALLATGQDGWRIDDHWPWAMHSLKKGEPRRMLEKAGALILAEIERIDRAANKET